MHWYVRGHANQIFMCLDPHQNYGEVGAVKPV